MLSEKDARFRRIEKLNIVSIYPNLSVKLSSFAQVPVYFGEQGHKTIVITCQQMNAFKGEWSFPEQEMIGGTLFYRPYDNLTEQYDQPPAHYGVLKEKLRDFNPQIIFCSGQGNIKLVRMIKKDFNIPAILLSEYATDPLMVLQVRGTKSLRKLKLGFILKPFRYFYWKKLCRIFDAIMVACFSDKKHLDKLSYFGAKIHYAPWCNQIPEFKKQPREKGTGIHIGSLQPFKNSQELIKTIPIILEKTPTEKFVVIGPGPIAAGVLRLKQRYGRRIEYIKSLPRQEAISYLARSFYAYTPVTNAGLGFIGDSWGARTPLVATHDVGGFLKNREDTLISEQVMSVDRVISELYDNDQLYNSLIENGYRRYLKHHTKEAVGQNYLSVFSSLIKKED